MNFHFLVFHNTQYNNGKRMTAGNCGKTHGKVKSNNNGCNKVWLPHLCLFFQNNKSQNRLYQK